MTYQLHLGDCLEVLAGLPDNSVDSIVTDPPYGLSFMGKRWDYDVPSVAIWEQCLRVLKPGGHLLAFAGTRTQHRMAVRIEDAGFEIRDMIAWVYGCGFSKGFNMNRVEACDCGGNAIPSAHGKTESKHDVRRMRGTHLSKAVDSQKEHEQSLFASVQQQPSGTSSALHARGDSEAGGENAWQEQPSVGGWQIHRTREGLRHGEDAIASEGEAKWLRSRACPRGGEDAWKTASCRGGGSPQEPKQGGQQVGESGGFLEPQGTLDAGALRGRGACPQCGKLKAEFVGFGTALKPALEPITMARKPLIGTVAENVLTHGTGAINVDGCRVGDEVRVNSSAGNKDLENRKTVTPISSHKETAGRECIGRWPANLIHDGSNEACLALKSGARFFYSAKAGKDDRNEGCESFEEKPAGGMQGRNDGSLGTITMSQNHHPTVKPTTLMAYLCRLVTPPGGTVLDPFMGSGSTGKAATVNGFRFIGIERDPAYHKIAEARISNQHQGRLL